MLSSSVIDQMLYIFSAPIMVKSWFPRWKAFRFKSWKENGELVRGRPPHSEGGWHLPAVSLQNYSFHKIATFPSTVSSCSREISNCQIPEVSRTNQTCESNRFCISPFIFIPSVFHPECSRLFFFSLSDWWPSQLGMFLIELNSLLIWHAILILIFSFDCAITRQVVVFFIRLW